jgi:hypothetical protein
MSDLTPDGYRIIQPMPKNDFEDRLEKGVQCGQCGMKFDHGKTYGYYCPHQNCPVYMKPSF